MMFVLQSLFAYVQPTTFVLFAAACWFISAVGRELIADLRDDIANQR